MEPLRKYENLRKSEIWRNAGKPVEKAIVETLAGHPPEECPSDRACSLEMTACSCRFAKDFQRLSEAFEGFRMIFKGSRGFRMDFKSYSKGFERLSKESLLKTIGKPSPVKAVWSQLKTPGKPFENLRKPIENTWKNLNRGNTMENLENVLPGGPAAWR